jgi:hypothetical protein
MLTDGHRSPSRHAETGAMNTKNDRPVPTLVKQRVALACDWIGTIRVPATLSVRFIRIRWR